MTGRKKALRNMAAIISIYIILNVLVYGIMTAYMNTRNIMNEDKLTMAEVTGMGSNTKIKILGKEYSANIGRDTGNTIITVLYCVVGEKIRACTELITQAREYFFE